MRTYNLNLTYSNDTDALSTQKVISDNNELGEIEFPPTGDKLDSVSIQVELEAGIQTITLSLDTGKLAFDYTQLTQ